MSRKNMPNTESKNLIKMRSLLEFAAKSPPNEEEREKKSIELATLILKEANAQLTPKEKKKQSQLKKILRDPVGKPLLTTMTDQGIRSKTASRTADQLTYLLDLFGVPTSLPPLTQLYFHLFKIVSNKFPTLAMSFIFPILQQQLAPYILLREKNLFTQYVKKKKEEGISLHLHHLGKEILGEAERKRKIQCYLSDLKNPSIASILIPISTLHSSIDILALETTLEKLSLSLKDLYRTAAKNSFLSPEGKPIPKKVILDVEDSQYLYLAKELFIRVLSEEEFHSFSAGLTLDSYFPETTEIFEEIAAFAASRVRKKGAPIYIRLTKGSNRFLEQAKASSEGWPQATYLSKAETDANYKHLLIRSLEESKAKAFDLYACSHNVLDIAFTLILFSQQEHTLYFEMKEGVANHIYRALKPLTKQLVLTCISVQKEELKHALAFLSRRLDEHNTTDNSLSPSFSLQPDTKEWKAQIECFSESIRLLRNPDQKLRRIQNRFHPPLHLDRKAPFENEPNTDFSLPVNQEWANSIIEKGKNRRFSPIPLVINGKEILDREEQNYGYDPSKPTSPLYSYASVKGKEINNALQTAKKAEKDWQATPFARRIELLMQVAEQIRIKRTTLLEVLIADTGKKIVEADLEITKAIDFVEYYLRCQQQFTCYRDLQWEPKGTILIASSWNSPVSTPTSGLCAALITGNCALFTPSKKAVATGFFLSQIFWDAGISPSVLQFIPCIAEDVYQQLIQDKRLNDVILTGSAERAKQFLQLRPDLSLTAETGGKNNFILTALADRELAIKDLIYSAFSYNGQKCSAVSIAILEAEVYDDPNFREALKEAVSHLTVGSAWDLSSQITPLITPPKDSLYRGLTTLEPQESWLVQPKQDRENKQLFSPGIKWNVQKGSFTQQKEMLGPILGVMRAENLDHAIHLANSTPYLLAAGIHTLDRREQKKWQQLITASSCYINNPVTDGIVRRNPFGGYKKSNFGQGLKVSGPNYLLSFERAVQIGMPKEKLPLGQWANNLTRFLEKFDLSTEDLGIWYASVSSYAFFWQQFKRDKDNTKIIGEDNYLRYLPQKKLVLRITPRDAPIDYLRAFAAALTCGVRLEVSWEKDKDAKIKQANWGIMLPIFNIIEEDQEHFLKRIPIEHIKRIRMLHKPDISVFEVCAKNGCHLNDRPVLANGRIELLHYLREVSISTQYHRYGNLGIREGELRRSNS